MAEEFTLQGTGVGEMHARREVMADGRRYIIYYTFGTDDNADNGSSEEAGDV
ncbi:MAG: hypothetical protein ABI791_09515 [Acidobacteriota bacterium]